MIHQAKSNPQLLDEQIFSERLASAISAIGPQRRSGARPVMSAVGGKRTLRLLAPRSLSVIVET
jgi:hypothetical protein